MPPSCDDGSAKPTPNLREEAFTEEIPKMTDPLEEPEQLPEQLPEGEDGSLEFTETAAAETQDPDGPIEILELDFSLGNSEENAATKGSANATDPPLQLKKRDDVYYQLYKEERAKAKKAKQIALAHYLEAKRIKTTFLMQDMSDSDSGDDVDDGSGLAEEDGMGV